MLRLVLTSEMYSILIHADVVDHIPKTFQHFSDFITDIEEYLSKQHGSFCKFWLNDAGKRGRKGEAACQAKGAGVERDGTGVSPTYLLNYILVYMFFYYTLYTSFKELTVQVLKYQTD